MDFNSLHHKECYIQIAEKKQDHRAIKPINNPSKTQLKLGKDKSEGTVIITKPLDHLNLKYQEEQLIPGKNIYEVISNISQKDKLDETIYDSYRCGAGSLVNAYMLLGGKFEKLSKKFSMNSELTYKNIHIIQDKLYKDAKANDKIGLESSFIYHFNNSGKITSTKPIGEMNNAAGEIGLKITPIIGNTVKTIDNKKESVNSFLDKNNGVLQVSVYLNPNTGELSNNHLGIQNHYVTVFRHDNNFYLADTGQIYNGRASNLKELSENEIDELIYNTPALISGITLKDN